MANTRGGTILVGISDNGVVRGVTEDPKWKDRLTEILRNRMEPVSNVERREAVSKGARIYVIDVMQGGGPPYAVDIQNPTIYVRRRANDQKGTVAADPGIHSWGQSTQKTRGLWGYTAQTRCRSVVVRVFSGCSEL